MADYYVTHTFEIWSNKREKFLELIRVFRKNCDDLGCASYEVIEDDEKSGHFTEIIGFDSYSHYIRLSKKHPLREVEAAYKELLLTIVDGEKGIKNNYYVKII
jgi:hypothetical protein